MYCFGSSEWCSLTLRADAGTVDNQLCSNLTCFYCNLSFNFKARVTYGVVFSVLLYSDILYTTFIVRAILISPLTNFS